MRNVTLSLIDKGSSYRQRNTQKSLKGEEEDGQRRRKKMTMK
jgi:hypothetical protein